MIKTYHLTNGVRVVAGRDAHGPFAALWLTWNAAPMNMTREQMAAHVRIAKRTKSIEATT